LKTEENNPEHWFLLGAERLRAADVLFAHESSTYTGVEILQESVERYLKGFLIANGWTLQKIHDLTVLNDQAKVFSDRFELFDELCESLTEQFWAQHYPGGDLSTVGADYEMLRQQTGELIRVIQTLMPQFFQTSRPDSPH
jgi:HEPN domain-containing protein